MEDLSMFSKGQEGEEAVAQHATYQWLFAKWELRQRWGFEGDGGHSVLGVCSCFSLRLLLPNISSLSSIPVTLAPLATKSSCREERVSNAPRDIISTYTFVNFLKTISSSSAGLRWWSKRSSLEPVILSRWTVISTYTSSLSSCDTWPGIKTDLRGSLWMNMSWLSTTGLPPGRFPLSRVACGGSTDSRLNMTVLSSSHSIRFVGSMEEGRLLSLGHPHSPLGQPVGRGYRS